MDRVRVIGWNMQYTRQNETMLRRIRTFSRRRSFFDLFVSSLTCLCQYHTIVIIILDNEGAKVARGRLAN